MKSFNTGRSAISTAVRLCLAGAAVSAAGAALAATPAPSATPAAGNIRIIVAYKNDNALQARMAIGPARDNVKMELDELGAVVLEVSPKALAELRKDPNVAYVEEDVKRYALSHGTRAPKAYLPGQTIPYGISMVQANLLPDTNAGNRTLCIIDSGYDRAHEDLAGNKVSGSFDRGTVNWYTDENSHGTHVAGTIAAINNAGVGVVGVAANRKLKLHIVKVFGADGWAYSSTLAHAAKQCGKAGANVISMSLGGAGKGRALGGRGRQRRHQRPALSCGLRKRDDGRRARPEQGVGAVFAVQSQGRTVGAGRGRPVDGANGPGHRVGPESRCHRLCPGQHGRFAKSDRVGAAGRIRYGRDG